MRLREGEKRLKIVTPSVRLKYIRNCAYIILKMNGYMQCEYTKAADIFIKTNYKIQNEKGRWIVDEGARGSGE
jgi:hypothetical protein